MLKETTALDFWAFREDYDIDNVISVCKEQFCENLIKIFHQRKQDSEKYPVNLSCLDNYTVFRNMYNSHKNITFNTKNLIFETCVTDLWDRFVTYLERQKDKRGSQDPYMEEQLVMNGKLDKASIDQVTSYDKADYHAFFGSGEFPFMNFTVIRIGTKEYSFWNIVR